MPFMEWTDDLTVGVDVIDQEHKQLIALINELSDAVEAGSGHDVLANTLEGLVYYVSYHFSHEEGLYLRSHFPAYEGHRKEHVALSNQVMEMQAKFNAGADEAFAREVLEFLKNWLYNHIIGSDRKFGVYLNTSGAGRI